MGALERQRLVIPVDKSPRRSNSNAKSGTIYRVR